MTAATQHAGETNARLVEDKGQPASRSPADRKLVVIAGRCGRLANRLVLFANFIALAEEQGHRLINFTFHSYAGLFGTTSRDIYCQYPVAERKSWLDAVPALAGALRKTRLCYRAVRAASKLNERLPIFGRAIVTLRESPGQAITVLDGPEVQAKIREARIVFVNGWNFRAPDCVRRHAVKIRSYFRPIAAYEQSSRQAVDRLRQDANVVVGVHVRQGDYRRWRGGKYFFPISQYAAWMRELAEQFPARKVSFLVCSDDQLDAREFPELPVGFGAGSPVGDLYALAKCDCVFGPPSTFSQWASFYGDTPLLHLYDRGGRIERGKFCVSYLGEIPK